MPSKQDPRSLYEEVLPHVEGNTLDSPLHIDVGFVIKPRSGMLSRLLEISAFEVVGVQMSLGNA